MSSIQPYTLGSGGAQPDAFDQLDMVAIHRAARRADRLRHLGDVRKNGVYLAEQLSDYVACRLPYDQDAILKKIEDPTLAYCRVAKTIRQTVMLEERLDNEDEARLAGTPIPKAPEPKAAAAFVPSQDDRKQPAREAAADIRAAMRPEIEPAEREYLRDELSEDAEAEERFTGTDPTVAMARICLDLGLIPPDWDEEDEAAPDQVARLMARWIDITRTHLDPPAERKPPGKGQGPPTQH